MYIEFQNKAEMRKKHECVCQRKDTQLFVDVKEKCGYHLQHIYDSSNTS